MLPLSLKVHNFLSYRDDAPTLHLEDIHVACLCGPNGNGKSALLDAITWAIWGKTARGQRQEQLIHHGQSEMRVELEFEENSRHYRAIRRFSKTTRATAASLELAIASGDDWAPLTANTMKETARELEHLIGMDYETFVNSAYLLQGRSDEFTMAQPAERKEVLARVLGLELYDRLSERARHQARDVQSKAGLSNAHIQRLEAETAQHGDVEARLAEASLAAERARAEANATRADLEKASSAVNQLERRRAEGENMAAEAARLSQRLQREARERSQFEQRVQQEQALLEQAPQIEQGFAELRNARVDRDALSDRAQRVHQLQEQLAPIQNRIAAERGRLEARTGSLEREINGELRSLAESLPGVQQRLAKLDKENAALGEGRAQIEGYDSQHRALIAEAEFLKNDNARLKVEGKETRSKLTLLNHKHVPGAECPLCGVGLTKEGRKRLESTYKAQIEAQIQRYNAQAAKEKSLKMEAQQLSTLMERTEKRVDSKYKALTQERARVLAQEEKATAAGARREEARAELTELEGRIEAQAFAQNEQQQASDLQAQIDAVAFDSREFDALRQQVRTLEHWEDEHKRLEEARRRLDDDQASLANAVNRIKGTTEEIAQIVDKQHSIEAELLGLPEARRRSSELKQAEKSAEERLAGLQQEQGSLATQLEQIRNYEVELEEHKQTRAALGRDASLYDELSSAFGKRGVQALLIEAAIPRLEDEANDLLSRMTDGRMSLKMQTQQARRAGKASDGLVETLHIDVADELGSRSYDLFSGGERFRVDLALRIALSKLLAWRAGAQLPTLFIDEGFGTQDAQGRDRIVEAVKAIEDDFQRVLVITHMDEVKEAFPVRIEVSRAVGGGSTFSVS